MSERLRALRRPLLSLLHRPLYLCAAASTVALGIGVTSGIFTVISAVVLRPLPYAKANQLVMVWSGAPQDGANAMVVSVPDFLDWKERNRSFSDLAIFNISKAALIAGDEPEQLAGAVVSTNFFSVLGVKAAQGRTFTAEEGVPGQNLVVILSHSLWRRRFGGDPSIVGSTIRLQGQTRTVVGILSEGFRHPEPFFLERKAEYWVPLLLDVKTKPRINRSYRVIARLRDGVGMTMAQSDMENVVGQLAKLYPDTNRWLHAAVVPLREQLAGNLRPLLLLAWATAGCVLMIVLANSGNLQLARAAERVGEGKIRLALGASPLQVAQLALTESLLLSLLGGACGLVLAQWISRVMTRANPLDVTLLDDVSIDWRVMLFGILVALLTGCLAALLPMAQLSRSVTAPGPGRREGTGERGPAGWRARNLLVLAEVALTLPLLVSAVLLSRSLIRLTQADPGLRVPGLLSFRLQTAADKYPRILDELRALPGVRGASMVSCFPFTGLNDQERAFLVEGQSEPGQQVSAHYRVVGPDYFGVMGIPILRGNGFDPREVEEGQPEVVINRVLSERLWPGENAVGKRVKLIATGPDASWSTVIGVVGNIRPAGLFREPEAEFYVRHDRDQWSAMGVVLRVSGDSSTLVPAIRRRLRQVEPELPLEDIHTMAERLAARTAVPRFQALLVSALAIIALALTGIGVFGLINYWISLRRHELGVRIAVGATRRDVLLLIVGKGALLGAGGTALGLGLALWFARALSHQLPGVNALEPMPYGMAALFVLIAVLIAASLPAYAAIRSDPATALRYN